MGEDDRDTLELEAGEPANLDDWTDEEILELLLELAPVVGYA